MKGEPRYSAQERRERAKEVEVLRRQAVASWNADRVGDTALVILTFGEYLAMAGQIKRLQAALSAATGRL